MKKAVILILIFALCISFASCKEPEGKDNALKFEDIAVAVNSETGVQAGLHTPLINIFDFEKYKNELGVTLNVNIKDQDNNEVLLNEDGKFLVEYDKVYSIVYTLNCEGKEPLNYFATVTALTSDMVEEPPKEEEPKGEYDHLSFVPINSETCDVSANINFDQNKDYLFSLPKNLIIPSEFNGKTVVAVVSFSESDIETVLLPASVKTVEIRTFSLCGKLTSINLQAVTQIKKGAFYKCLMLTSLSLDSVENIGEEAFLGCSGLTDIDIGQNAVNIGYNAFKNCTALNSLTIRANTVIDLSETYINNLSGVTIYVPAALIGFYQSQNPTLTFSAIA